MPGRNFSSEKYRYGFNGQERSTEIQGNSFTAEFWQYDARIGRRWNTDPKPNASISMYSCLLNNPIWYNDITGDTAITEPPSGNNYDNYEQSSTTGYQSKKDIGSSTPGTRMNLVYDKKGDRYLTLEVTKTVEGHNGIVDRYTQLYYWSERPQTPGTGYAEGAHWVPYDDDVTSRAKGSIEVGELIGESFFKITYTGASMFAGGGVVGRFVTESTGQFMASGGSTNSKDYNLTALLTSLVPGLNNSVSGYVAKNGINSFAQVNANFRYEGVNSSWNSVKEKTVQAGIGLAFDYGLSKFQVSGTWSMKDYTRLRNLSYKPKIAVQFSQYVSEHSRKSFISGVANSVLVGSINTAAANIVSDNLK